MIGENLPVLSAISTPLVRLGNLFPGRQVYAKCEFLAPSGSFKWHATVHLLEHLRREGRTRELVVPSMGNTALAVAAGARAFGFAVTGVVPPTISRAKDEKLQALGVSLLKVAGGGNELLRRAAQVAEERGAYFVHPHLDPLWTDGYAVIAEQILAALPGCRSLVFPIGGGGLLMGLTAFLARHPAPVRPIACETYNFPTYARYEHERSATIADGLVLGDPHPPVRQRIDELRIPIHLVKDSEIRAAMAGLYAEQGLVVEPSSAVTVACVQTHPELEEPICVVLTGENITREDFHRLIADS
jgi:threonine dehydratase